MSDRIASDRDGCAVLAVLGAEREAQRRRDCGRRYPWRSNEVGIVDRIELGAEERAHLDAVFGEEHRDDDTEGAIDP